MNSVMFPEELIKNYKTEFSLRFNNLFKSLVVVADPKDDGEFINLCDSIYVEHFNGNGKLSVYFFRNVESAGRFTYLRLVQDESEDKALCESQCIGYLTNNSLSIVKEKPAIVKKYS